MLDRAVDDMGDRMTSAYLRTRRSNNNSGSISTGTGTSRTLSFGGMGDEMKGGGSLNQFAAWNQLGQGGAERQAGEIRE